tara:strand:+ start:328 stop:561 length:234 start_codon:yes stop_codon:yes gene_type:complete
MKELIEELLLIVDDDAMPRNVKEKIKVAIIALKAEDVEQNLRASQALQALDDLSENPNIPSYIRPQLWNVVSQLETI